MKTNCKAIALLILLAINANAHAEIRIPLGMVSKHFPARNFNEKHPGAGVVYQSASYYAGYLYYIDSYNKKSHSLYSGIDKQFSVVNLYAEGGITRKGTQLASDESPVIRVVPYGQIGARFDIGPAYIKLGLIPIPKKLGSSVGTMTVGFRIK